MSEEKNIPESWKIKKLGEYVISVKGKKPKQISSVQSSECNIP